MTEGRKPFRLPNMPRYELAYHTNGHWRIVDHMWRAYAGLPYPDGVHRPLMFSLHTQAEEWLMRCAERGLEMRLPDGAKQMNRVEYERWRATVG